MRLCLRHDYAKKTKTSISTPRSKMSSRWNHLSQSANGTHDAGFPRQRLNVRFSCWHKLAIDTSISCIHSYICEYVAIRKRLSKIHICENKRLSIVVTRAIFLNVYGDEFHFVDKILLERQGNKTTFDFLYMIPNEHVFYLLLVP